MKNTRQEQKRKRIQKKREENIKMSKDLLLQTSIEKLVSKEKTLPILMEEPLLPPEEEHKNFKEELEKRAKSRAKKDKPFISDSPNLKIVKEGIQRLCIRNSQSPGDILMLTATIRDLNKAYPGKFKTAVRTSCKELWDNNPYISDFDVGADDVINIKANYPLIHRSNTSPYHFIHGFTQDFEELLKVKIPVTDFKADIYLSDEEKSWVSQVEELGIKDDFWVLAAGGKYDYTAKWANPQTLQKVVDYFRGGITFVQIGQKDHWHPPLKGVVNLIGKTNLRQLIRLIYHSVGVLCPVTFAMHAAAGVPVPEHKMRPLNRACVVIAGGREPMQWEAYPHHRYLCVNGCLPCCDNGGCWKSRCQKVGDGDDKDKDKNLCEFPVNIGKDYKTGDDLFIPKCMNMITADDIIRAIEMYYEADMIRYGSSVDLIDVSEKSPLL